MPIEETLCPVCDTKMVPAKNKNGHYWRCPRWGCIGVRDSEGRSKEDKEKEDYEDED